MAVTIATHMGHNVSRQHNRRNRNITDKEAHIDPNGKHETWLDVDHRQAYEILFGKAVKRYNEKQKRADRQIEDYYTTIKKDKNKHPVYECIVGVYGDVSEQEAKKILQEYIKGWYKENPNMRLIGAYYHADEQGSPHLHLDYIPVGHGFKRGMDTQNSVTKALEEQGFKMVQGQTAQMQWTRSENERLESICKAHGLEVRHPQREKNVQHLETELYKVKKELAEQKEAMQTIESSFHVFQALEEQYKVSMDKTSLELFCEQEGIDYNGLMRLFNIEPNKEKARKQSQGNKDDIELEL